MSSRTVWLGATSSFGLGCLLLQKLLTDSNGVPRTELQFKKHLRAQVQDWLDARRQAGKPPFLRKAVCMLHLEKLVGDKQVLELRSRAAHALTSAARGHRCGVG
jgi:hypothetical protein